MRYSEYISYFGSVLTRTAIDDALYEEQHGFNNQYVLNQLPIEIRFALESGSTLEKYVLAYESKRMKLIMKETKNAK